MLSSARVFHVCVEWEERVVITQFFASGDMSFLRLVLIASRCDISFALRFTRLRALVCTHARRRRMLAPRAIRE